MGGVVAAGHELTADAGAQVLRAGGNAVDAAIGAMLASFVAEPLLTGLGAGGYMLVAGPRDGAPPPVVPAPRAAARPPSSSRVGGGGGGPPPPPGGARRARARARVL